MPGAPEAADPKTQPTTFNGTNDVARRYVHIHESEVAAFGEVNYLLTDKLKATAGVRVARSQNSYHQELAGSVFGSPTSPVFTPTQPTAANPGGNPFPVAGQNIYTVTDLFRYKGNNPSNSLAGSPVRDLTPGAHKGVFSIDGGATNLGFYNKSDGSAGDYADWDTTMIGDPFGESAPGAPYSMTGNDVVQMAALGYNMSTQGKQLAAALHAYTSD